MKPNLQQVVDRIPQQAWRPSKSERCKGLPIPSKWVELLECGCHRPVTLSTNCTQRSVYIPNQVVSRLLDGTIVVLDGLHHLRPRHRHCAEHPNIKPRDDRKIRMTAIRLFNAALRKRATQRGLSYP